MKEKSRVKIPEAVVEGIRSADSVILLTHVHPDGDAIGSSLGFADILTGLGKSVCVFLEEPISHLYTFLPGSDKVITNVDQVLAFADAAQGTCIVIALDSGDDQRLGKYVEKLLQISPFYVIDHHKSHKKYGDDRWVDPSMSSTGEMIFELAQKLSVSVSYPAAVNLYVAICTDTGSFRYESTTRRTHEIIAALLGMGVRPEKIAQCLYDNVTLARMKLLQLVLSTLKVYENGQLAFVHVTKGMVEESGASKHDIEGFVDYPRSLGTVKVATFIKEADNGVVSVSLRAKGELDVADVANYFGGGGHRNAAGFRVKGMTLDGIHNQVLDVLRNRLN